MAKKIAVKYEPKTNIALLTVKTPVSKHLQPTLKLCAFFPPFLKRLMLMQQSGHVMNLKAVTSNT